MPGEIYRRRLGSFFLYLCCVFRALINSLVCWFCTSALGFVLFQIWPLIAFRQQQQQQQNCHWCTLVTYVARSQARRTLVLSMQEWFLWLWSIEHAPVPRGPCSCQLLSYSGVHFIKCIIRAEFRCSVFLFMVGATAVFTVCSDLYKTLYCSVFFMLSAVFGLFYVVSGYCIHCMFRSVQNTV